MFSGAPFFLTLYNRLNLLVMIFIIGYFCLLVVYCVSGLSTAGGAADAALKQVDLLKRELAEMRSGNLADEHAMHDLQQMAAVERAVNKARGITSAADTENAHEKSAHRETHEALEDSEKSVR